MSISFEKLKSTLKDTGFPVFRDKAKKGTDYPYIVYSNVNKGRKKLLGKYSEDFFTIKFPFLLMAMSWIFCHLKKRWKLQIFLSQHFQVNKVMKTMIRSQISSLM